MELVLFLAGLNKVGVDYLVKPIRQKYPDVDLWWMVYVALVTGFVISWLSEANALSDYIDNVFLARALTGVMVGGGASLIHDLFSATVSRLKSN